MAAGNYELAAKLAGECGDDEILAIAVLMSGGLARGLERLDAITFRHPETRLYAAYGCWCLDRRDDALRHLAALTSSDFAGPAQRLRVWIERQSISVAVLADPNNARGAPLMPDAQFAVRHLLPADVRGTTDSELCALLAGCDLLVGYDSVSAAVMAAAAHEGVATAIVSVDFDQRLADLYPILSRADVVLAGTALEHHLLSGLFAGRISAFPGLPFREPRGFIPASRVKDIDIFCSGVSFVPHWPDKARLLYRIAAIDDPTLKIVICDGYVDGIVYRDMIRRAKYVPLVNRLEFSVHQDRTTEVLHWGANGLGVGGIDAHWLLEAAGRCLPQIDPATLETDIARIAASDPQDTGAPDVRDAVSGFYPPPPLRDSRTLKFALFESLFARTDRTAGLSDLTDMQRTARDHTVESFARFMETPLDAAVQAAVLDALDGERGLRPAAIAPIFNKARILWLIGHRADAATLFRQIVDMPPSSDAIRPTDFLLPHRMRALSGLMPYQAFFQGMVLDCMERASDFPRVRAVIAATCLTYLSLDASLDGRVADGAAFSRRALTICDRHHPAAAQLAKSSFAAGHPPTEILRGYLAATELYPPLIDELLPIGIDAMERLGFPDLAESHVRRWLYAVSRIAYMDSDVTPTPRQTVDFAMRYFARMPEGLKLTLKALQSGDDARPKIG